MNTKEIIKHIDYTFLKATATEEDIFNLCKEAEENNCASVCIPSSFVNFAHQLFPNLTICTVVGFPLGNCTTETKCTEAYNAVKDGAKEIDMVINIGKLKRGEYPYVTDEINKVKRSCGDGVILKVIVETCYLTEQEIRIITRLIDTFTYADYIKTSTGFGSRGASFEDIALMKSKISYGLKIKASGGIRTKEDMEKYLKIGCDRIGASALPKG